MAISLKNIFGGKEEEHKAIDWASYPARLLPGLFFINSGIGKAGADEETAKGLQSFASTVPFTDMFEPKTFAKLLSTAEIGIGSALSLPFIPNRLAGAALTAFSTGLITMYLRTPGMTQENSKIRPSEDGTPLAKDFWLLGIGLSLMLRGNKA